MIEKTVKVYQYSELEWKAQEKIIERERDDTWGICAVNYDDEEKNLINDLKKELEKIGFSKIDIQYHGFDHQGDGASIAADVDLKEFFNDKMKAKFFNQHPNLSRIFLDMIIKDFYDLFYLQRTGWQYVHENSITAGYSDFVFYFHYDDKKQKHVYKRADDKLQEYATIICEFLDDFQKEKAKELYSNLEAAYDWYYCDEFIESYLQDEANGCLYYANGDEFIEY